MSNKWTCGFVGGVIAVLGWPIIKAVLYVVLATLAALFGALTTVTTPSPKPVETQTTTSSSQQQQQPLTNDRLLAELRQDRQQDRDQQKKVDGGQDQAIKEVKTSVDQLRTSVDNLARPAPSAAPPCCGRGDYMEIPPSR